MQNNVAPKIIEQLAAWGIKKAFGYIGDDVFYMFDALARQNDIKLYQVIKIIIWAGLA